MLAKLMTPQSSVLSTVFLSGTSHDKTGHKKTGFGSDGAPVIAGTNGGVATLYKKQQPCIQAVHCYAYKDTLNKIEIYKKLSGFLLNIYM